MRISLSVAGIITLGLLANAGAQTPPPKPAVQTPPPKPAAQTPPPQAGAPAQTPKPRPRPRPAAGTRIVVRDASGNPLSGVSVAVSGAARSQATTSADGTVNLTLGAGSYRLRFEREGFFALERDVTIRAGQAAEVEVALSAAPSPPAPPPPPTPPSPPPPAAAKGTVAAGPPVTLSVPNFIDKNFIGRDPLKESVLACTPDATTRLLQLRDPISAHKHADLDEILYIVAGDGGVRIGDQVTAVGPGSLSVIPRGVTHAIERRGRNPLIVLSTLAGAPCPPSVTPQTSSPR